MPGPAARKPPAEKYDERRRALAESALITLGELGYAKASLREIANNSDFSHGVVHYYFQDKHELIVFCVREQKSGCVRRYDDVIAGSATPEELVAGFADKLVETLATDTAMHRLWYDVRTQSMFEERLREVAEEIDGWLEDMVWRIVSRYAELAGGVPAMPASVLYAIVDGLFQQALIGVSAGRHEVLGELRTLVHGLLPTMITTDVTPGVPTPA
ncbi:TetR/AcrR family transcriptional regulator [Nocardioides sp. MH1]|uniref:TetR/AcrR family transcriptional regulator n=1 Tax=Nocardioides sp. MH1 TaxID=3242490 RepID=UPI003520610E